MSDVLDVITRLSYIVEDSGLKQTVDLLAQQITKLAQQKQLYTENQQALERGEVKNILNKKKLISEQAKLNEEIKKGTAAIEKEINSNKKLQNAIAKEVGIINQLITKTKSLQQARDAANDVTKINAYNKQIAITQAQLNKLTSSGGGILSKLGQGVLQGVGIGTGIGLVTQGVSAIQSFIAESSRLAAETEGVSRAFERLDKPDLLNNLREATRGTVSDLELMRNAVNFQNFGLPVEKLSAALAFATQRARDTGQSVEYLVQSVVLGIGRKSPLILDNLGINIKRINERFKETGDFAEAAFQIIQEETAKGGAAIDTFADKQARLNANIDNFKARIGGIFNSALGEFALGAERAFAIIEAFHNRFVGTQEEAEKESVKSLDDYLEDYKTTDEVGRRIIENQATASYERILSEQKRLEGLGLQSAAQALNGQANLYRDFFSKLKQKDVTFNNFTGTDLLGLTRDELEELKKEGETNLNPLAAGDKAGIAAINNRITHINAALDKFSIKVKKTKKEVEDKPFKFLFEQTPEEWAEDIDKRVAALNKLEKEIKDFRAQVDKDIEKPEGIQSLSELIGQESGFGESSQADATRLQLDIQLAREQRVKDEAEKERAHNEKEIRDERVRQEIQAYQSIVNAAVNAYNAITNAQLAAQDVQIAAQQRRVDQATELYKQGNVEVLKLEQERLDESIKKREEIARRQQIINAALTVSESILAIATAAGETGAGAIVIVPAVIAAIAAGFAAVTALSQENQQGFKDGVVDYQGKGTEKSDSNTVKISKGESVITADATKKYKAELEQMNAGTYRMVQIPKQVVTYHNSFATKGEMKGVEGKLDALIALNQNNGVSVKQNIDGNGVLQIVESNKRRDNRRFK